VAAASGVIAKRLLHRAAARLPLRLVYPDGTVIGAGEATSPALVINDPDGLARRIGRHGVLVWVVGVAFEAVGDRQLRVFKSDPEHRGVVMDRGL
jgi:Protein of unknown function (DUF1295)